MSTRYRTADVDTFTGHLTYALGATGAVLVGAWARWVFVLTEVAGTGAGDGAAAAAQAEVGHRWGAAEQLRLIGALGCNTTVAAPGGVPDPASACYTSAQFLWAGPFFFACVCWLFGALMHVLTRLLAAAEGSAGEAGARRRSVKVGTALLYFCAFIFLLLWVAASIAAAGSALAGFIVTIALCLLVEATLAVAIVVGWERLLRPLRSGKARARVEALRSSNWIRAAVLLALLPVLPLACGVAALNQLARRLTGVQLEPGDEKLCVTRAFHRQLAHVREHWPWASVLHCACVLCLGTVVMVVGVLNGTSVFLSALNDYLRSFPLSQTVAIYMAVGLCMFLCPVVPGVPVYITGGIVVTAAAEPSMGFAGGMALAAAVGWVVKMLSVLVQHVGIGARCGQSVAIRQLVAINSVNTRAMRLTLAPPGLNLRKVCILIGGPDWPTTVMTGILGLPVSQMLLGSTPVILLIAPTVMAGAFLLKPPTDAFASSMQSVMLAVASMVQAAALLAAFYFVADVASKREAEIVALPLDEAVAAADELSAQRARVRGVASDWRRDGFTPAMRRLLLCATACCALPAYAVMLAGERCFVSFAVSDSIAAKLGGDVANVVRPPGWACLGASAAGYALLRVYTAWLGCEVQKIVAAGGVPAGDGGSAAATRSLVKSDSLELQGQDHENKGSTHQTTAIQVATDADDGFEMRDATPVRASPNAGSKVRKQLEMELGVEVMQ